MLRRKTQNKFIRYFDRYKKYKVFGWSENLRYYKYKSLERLFPRFYCQGCHSFRITIENRRMNTCYDTPELNYVYCCLGCFDEIEEYWKERWDEYYSGLI